MKRLFTLLALLATASCAQAINPASLKPDTKMGTVLLASPYFYAAQTGMIRFNNEFTALDVTNWQLDAAISQEIRGTLSQCSRVTVVDVPYDAKALFAHYADKYNPNDTKGGWGDMLWGTDMPGYDFDRVKPQLLSLMAQNNLDYLYVTHEQNAYGANGDQFMRGAYGIHYEPNVGRLKLYYRPYARVIDRNGKTVANVESSFKPVMIPEAQYPFKWKANAKDYTPQDLQLFYGKTLEQIRVVTREQIKSMGIVREVVS